MNTLTSSRGSEARRLSTTNRTSMTIATTPARMHAVLSSAYDMRSMAYTPNAIARNSRAVPFLSTKKDVFSSLGRATCPMAIAAIPRGMLMRNIQCHESRPTSRPPRAGPMAKPRAAATVIIPSDLPRCLAGSSLTQIIGATAASAAAPIPCRILDATSTVKVGDRAQARDPMVNTTNPERKTLRIWPASAILPNGRSSPASMRK